MKRLLVVIGLMFAALPVGAQEVPETGFLCDALGQVVEVPLEFFGDALAVPPASCEGVDESWVGEIPFVEAGPEQGYLCDAVGRVATVDLEFFPDALAEIPDCSVPVVEIEVPATVEAVAIALEPEVDVVLAPEFYGSGPR